ncbi:MAG: hypothetical protein JWO94_1383 [Verrucomicrobiaceae bacterium]|nr:hypothetical protein [Verrucomicrobiaceae bacterium]
MISWFSSLCLLLDARPRSAAMNMAVDQALLETVATPVLRVYQWDEPSLTFGYSHDWAALRPGLPPWPAMRRWTGGGLVWHDEDTTYSLIVPAAHPWSQTRPLESYRLIHQSLAGQLPHGTLAGEEERLAGARCFDSPALFDILHEGNKIAGAGQRRNCQGLLHQGSIRLALGSPFWQQWAAVIADEVRVVHMPEEHVRVRAEALVIKRYGTVEWLERRGGGGA